MSEITKNDIEDALTRALELENNSVEFIEIASGINNSEQIKLEYERGIDIDSKSWIPLDDIPYGEEVIRAQKELSNIRGSIDRLEQLVISDSQAIDAEEFYEILDDVDNSEGVLEEISAENVIKASKVS